MYYYKAVGKSKVITAHTMKVYEAVSVYVFINNVIIVIHTLLWFYLHLPLCMHEVYIPEMTVISDCCE
jgi:hypothetical protein